MKIRTRFAPSPTGFLHIGGLRTALYNYLYAKKHNGDFILRIEDTDQSRLVDKATNNLLNTLESYGLQYDEGPKTHNKKGPYIQSQRLAYYEQYALQLVDSTDAYVCFQNNPDLETLTPEHDVEIARKRMQNENFVIKLKINKNETISTYDEIRGNINFDLNLIDDFIIIKSDGYPTYHFANVVDDHLMEISHVIRGEEWLPSLPKHIMLYQYLGWETPKFCHLPLLLNSDKSKLSKRQGDVAAEEFLKKGFLKDAIINFVALLGWHPSDNQEIFSLKELISTFSINRINKSGAVFDIEKLNWMNGVYIRNMNQHKFYIECEKVLKNLMGNIDNKNKLLRFSNYIQERINNMDDITKEVNLFYNKVFIKEKELQEFQYLEIFNLWVVELQKINDLNKESISLIIEKTKNNLNIKGKNLFLPLRLALIGSRHGPDIFSIIHILGLKDSIKNLTQWIK